MAEEDCDTVSSSTNTSRWSSPCCGSDGSQHSSDCEERADRTPDGQPSAKLHGSFLTGYSKRVQGLQKQKMQHETPKLPPVRPIQASKPRNQSANMNCIWELKSQVWDLQQQLSEARAENKLLKKVQHHLRAPEDSISQILAKHRNETKALQSLLRGARTCRDNLARQLQSTETKLLGAKEALQHLRQLNQDHSLLEREELSLKLARATTQLEDKDRKLQNMERTLELQQESFKRQLVTEQRKIREARNTSRSLQEHILQLARELQIRETQVQKHNIYYHRICKELSKKGGENKTVQTDGLVQPSPCLWNGDVLVQKQSLQHQGNSHYNNQLYESMAIKKPEGNISESTILAEDHPEDESFRENTKQESYLEESPEKRSEQQAESNRVEETEALEGLQLLEEKEAEGEMKAACDLETTLQAKTSETN